MAPNVPWLHFPSLKCKLCDLRKSQTFFRTGVIEHESGGDTSDDQTELIMSYSAMGLKRLEVLGAFHFNHIYDLLVVILAIPQGRP